MTSTKTTLVVPKANAHKAKMQTRCRRHSRSTGPVTTSRDDNDVDKNNFGRAEGECTQSKDANTMSSTQQINGPRDDLTRLKEDNDVDKHDFGRAEGAIHTKQRCKHDVVDTADQRPP